MTEKPIKDAIYYNIKIGEYEVFMDGITEKIKGFSELSKQNLKKGRMGLANMNFEITKKFNIKLPTSNIEQIKSWDFPLFFDLKQEIRKAENKPGGGISPGTEEDFSIRLNLLKKEIKNALIDIRKLLRVN